MKQLAPFAFFTIMSAISLNANASMTLDSESLGQICSSTASGAEMVNLTEGGEFMFLTDANNITHKTFVANGKTINYNSMSEFWQTQVLDGLKHNYDIIACVSPEGNVNPNIGIYTTNTKNNR